MTNFDVPILLLFDRVTERGDFRKSKVSSHVRLIVGEVDFHHAHTLRIPGYSLGFVNAHVVGLCAFAGLGR